MERVDQGRIRRVGAGPGNGPQLRRLWAVAAVVALLGCSAPATTHPEVAEEVSDATLRYAVTHHAGILSVEVRCERSIEGRWMFRRGQGLIETVGVGSGEATARVSQGKFQVPPGTRRLRYVYPIPAAMEMFGGRFRTGVGSGASWLVGGEAYLARPVKVRRERPVEVRYLGEVPLVPWETHGGKAHVQGADLIDPGFHTFGGQRIAIMLSGRRVGLTILEGRLSVADTDVAAWIEQAARELLTARDTLPYPRTQVTIVPVPDSGGVQFGQVLHSRPPSVAIYLGEYATIADLRGDWVAVHELSHLIQPRMRPRCNWLSEGLATYYQEVARARSGRKTRAQVWRNVLRGVRWGQGEADGRDLADLSERMHETHAYRAVYWGGAIIALALDVELRRVTKGKRSLDDVIAALHARGDGSLKAFAAEVDAKAGQPIYERVASGHLSGPALSRADELFEALEIGVTRTQDAPLSAIRKSILDKP